MLVYIHRFSYAGMTLYVALSISWSLAIKQPRCEAGNQPQELLASMDGGS